MRHVLLTALWALAGCECLIERDVEVDRRCPPSQCESQCKCQPAEQCAATTSEEA